MRCWCRCYCHSFKIYRVIYWHGGGISARVPLRSSYKLSRCWWWLHIWRRRGCGSGNIRIYLQNCSGMAGRLLWCLYKWGGLGLSGLLLSVLPQGWQRLRLIFSSVTACFFGRSASGGLVKLSNCYTNINVNRRG